MATFVLVHGAFHAGWCWYKVAPLLETLGHRVVAVDLPGHGRHRGVGTLGSYRDFLVDLLGGQVEPVVLVGHSMGGGIITVAAEAVPQKIAKLVYLSAWIGPSGRYMSNGLADMARADGLIPFGEEALDMLYPDCPPEDRALARLCLTEQPVEPLLAPIDWTPERWGAIPRAFIACRDDIPFPIADQRARADIAPGTDYIELASGHSPFFSMPETLAATLDALARVDIRSDDVSGAETR